VFIEFEVKMTQEIDKLDPKQYFLDQLDVGDNRLADIVGDALRGAEDGELFLESKQNEGLVLKESRIQSSSFKEQQGFGLRRVHNAFEGCSYGSDLNLVSLGQAAKSLHAVSEQGGVYQIPPARTQQIVYPPISPLGVSMEERIKLLQEIDLYIRAQDSRVREVQISLSGEVQQVLIVRADGLIVSDVRPLVSMTIFILLEGEDGLEQGFYGFGGRENYSRFFESDEWKRAADEALAKAKLKLMAKPCPAGEMTVVLGPGIPALLLHEAIGHGFEGDFHLKKSSAFTGLLGERVAIPEVTIVDDGTIPGRRGSLTVDDEGTPTKRTILVENGIIASWMHSRKTARLLGVMPTGNCRRQSFKYKPLVRMRNTLMVDGPHDPEEIIRETKKGLFIQDFSGGSVDITSGKFVFAADVAHLIEDGEITTPVKGAMLSGMGRDALGSIDRVGNNMALDPGIELGRAEKKVKELWLVLVSQRFAFVSLSVGHKLLQAQMKRRKDNAEHKAMQSTS